MSTDLPTYIKEGKKEIDWLRGVLNAILEVAPLSYKQKRKTVSFLNRMPDWLLVKWADVLNIDYAGGCAMYPYMVEMAENDTGKSIVQHYLEIHNAVPAANVLGDLAGDIHKRAKEDNLPTVYEIVEKQVCALALAEYTAEGTDFAGDASVILNNAESQDHPIINYHRALLKRDTEKIKALDAALAGGRYGIWVTERVNEYKRYLGLEPPHCTIRTGKRTPQWDLLWQRIFTGGDDN
ncbi:hypothetical protein C1O63_1475 [Dehalococcoides mccartyi]|uniref:hypothetical protein n=1 Tax=Dehalococcoides mccartyi TaxID=61435 RepID=UPI000CDF011A|nr:hypothetical protein [Dehalococcoides mccartyi]POZ58428.1 hypothetical protein C1O63_1475 [Dehalococcoides mccartyi]